MMAAAQPLNGYQMLGLMTEIGVTLAVPAALFGFGGAYLDARWNTSPLMILLGLAIAIAASTVAIYRRIKPFLNS